MKSKIIIGAELAAYRPRKDHSFSITFATQELSREQKQIIDDLYGRAVFLLIKDADEPIDETEEMVLDKVEIDLSDKTPSQRLRAVLYVLWQQKPQGFTEFKDFYKFKMEAAINKLKTQLDEV